MKYFPYNLHQPNMDSEIDDDVFYAELERQILILTAGDDDDDDFLGNTKLSNSMNVTKRSPKAAAKQPESYFDWMENESSNNSVPTWLLNLWRNGNGTGVFIPHIVKSKRKNKPRRKNNAKGRIYKSVANNKG